MDELKNIIAQQRAELDSELPLEGDFERFMAKWDEAESDSIFLSGYMYKQGLLGGNTGSKIDVVIWTDNYTDVHCTKDLDINSWETAKS